MPPYAAAAVLTVAVGFIADRTRQRGIANILVSLLGIVGFCMLIGASSPGARYAGTFLGAMGIYPAISNTISWTSNNTEGEAWSSAHVPKSRHKADSRVGNRCLQARSYSWDRDRLG